MKVYVESEVAMAYDRGCAAWTFDPAHWGVCGQGLDIEPRRSKPGPHAAAGEY